VYGTNTLRFSLLPNAESLRAVTPMMRLGMLLSRITWPIGSVPAASAPSPNSLR